MGRKRKGDNTKRLLIEPSGQTEMFEKSYEQEIREEQEREVECLGKKFPNDDARRAYFLDRLQEYLQDPEFRKIEGFPIGKDEAILALSDPPYYTACPNPFIAEFMKQYGRPYDPEEPYDTKPFAFDVTEGRHTWLYKAHTYHTKVPPKAIVRFIEHYAKPGDVVLDGFSGSGMTAVAASMTTPPRSVMSCDLSPAASFIGASYLAEVSPKRYRAEVARIADQLDEELSWMYRPAGDSKTPAICNYYVWSDVFLCASCGGDIVFWDAAFDKGKKKFSDRFKCPHCGSENSKRSDRAEETLYDHVLGTPWKRYKQVPVLAAVSTGKRRAAKRAANKADLSLLEKVRSTPPPAASGRLAVKMLFRDGQWGDQWKSCLHLRPITHAHQLFAERQLHYVARFLELLDVSRPEHKAILFTATSILQKTSRLMVYNADGIGRVQKGTLYISSVWQEMRFSHMLRIAADDMIRASDEGMWTTLPVRRAHAGVSRAVWTGSSTRLPVPSESVDYIFVDPPFGANIPYSELNFLWESLLSVFSDSRLDAIESGIQNKSLADYQRLMELSFSEFCRILKPGRWITVEFHNSRNAVWNAIQEALMRAGFVVADVRILDKKQVSFKQATSAGAVKQDLVITAYRPNGGLEERFRLEAGTEEGVWDFTKTHVKQLPVFVSKDGLLETLAERQGFLLFDRMVAFHVQRGVSVPLSAAEFYQGLEQRFARRDGMYFLPEQVLEYDKKRATVTEVEQLELFVSDEFSAIQWLRQQLTMKPQTFKELHPQFMKEISGWEKHEKPLELSLLLEDNFLVYNGREEVPSQIHGYLSSNYKELRNRPKDDPELCAKARDRWYVPDPKKAGDLEKVREKSLLREFEDYQSVKAKILKVFRIEAMRAGFKRAYDQRDYQTIVDVAARISESVLQEDEKLLMYYDVASMRLGTKDESKLF